MKQDPLLVGAAVLGLIALMVGIRKFQGSEAEPAHASPPPAQATAGAAPASTTPASAGGGSSLSSLDTRFSTPTDRILARYNKPYPTNLLVATSQLANEGLTSRWRVLDLCSQDQYQTRHVPGAVWVDYAAWNKAFRDGESQQAWEKRLAALGVDLDTTIVVYDEGEAIPAAHLRWMLCYWGFKDVRVLNGGWPAWLFQGGRQEAAVPRIAPRPIQLKPDSHRMIRKAELLAMVQLPRPRVQIVDARSRFEFSGAESRSRRNGAIPSARNLSTWQLLEPRLGRFRSADELGRLFREAGLDLYDPMVTYCQTGEQAALICFALEVMAAREVRLYYPGWSEWGNDNDTSITTHAVER
jgi:thiosulfate/3-mercaptopyruvate sulfurtransferase